MNEAEIKAEIKAEAEKKRPTYKDVLERLRVLRESEAISWKVWDEITDLISDYGVGQFSEGINWSRENLS